MTMVLNHFSAPILESSENTSSPRRSDRNPIPDTADSGADPNISDPRFHINRACIYERRLPSNAYITAHVQRLQHGFYSTPAVSDLDFDHVDFLGVSFVFHSPDTQRHRFKSATIRASVHGHGYGYECPPRKSTSRRSRDSRLSRVPRFLMHAPHLLYGGVSPETLQWNYSLAGSLGVAQLPLIASVSPAGGVGGKYRRYEMMRIQGSVRSLKSSRGVKFDVPAGELVWSLEENNLQQSGLPREFTFAMLIQKPHADSRVQFVLEIDPVLQSWFGSYPRWWLALPSYRPVRRRRLVDFRASVGQRFEPLMSRRGFNFATLASSFDDYVHMPGRPFALNITPDSGIIQDDMDSPMSQPVRPMPAFSYPEAPGAVPGFGMGSMPLTTIPTGPGQPSTSVPVAPGAELRLTNTRAAVRNKGTHRQKSTVSRV